MSKLKAFLYIVLALLTGAVLGTLITWNIVKNDTLLFVSLGLAALYIAYFVFLFIFNKKTGWQDEKTPLARLRKGEPLLASLYPYRGKKYVLCIYKADNVNRFLEWVKSGDEDNLPDGCEFEGWCTVKPSQLAEIEKQTFAIPQESLDTLKADAKLARFFKKNTVIAY